ncbi:tetratricopeptide repeat protein [Hymenobacter bucti]|uniref:Tetratricopeptide repeat protein n=1 Tax=Hymenobacter bucti TaxID=1844114 RepID=A0ABW4R0U9_9BACT
MAILVYPGAALFVGLLAWWLFKVPVYPKSPGNLVLLCEQELARRANAPSFRLLVMTHYREQAYEAALAASQRFQHTLSAEFGMDDLLLRGHLHLCLGQPQHAVTVHTHLLENGIASATIYNNRGYAYNMLAEYLLALQDFNRAIALQPSMAYAYNNRGLALHRLGMGAEGRADMEHSLRLDNQNAYAYRNLGIYHFDQGDYQAALPLFERAQRLGTAPPGLAAYLTQTRQQLGLG